MTQTSSAIQARREYQRQWRKANPDKVREHNRRHWEKKGQELLQNLKKPLSKGGAHAD